MRLVARVWVSVISCIDYSGKVYKICQKKQHLADADRVAEWTRAGAGRAVVMGSNPAQSVNSFFLFHSQKISKFFWRASYRYSKRKISSTGAGTVDTAY